MRLVYFVYQDKNAYERQVMVLSSAKFRSFIMIKFILL